MPNTCAVPSVVAGDNSTRCCDETASSLVLAATTDGVNLALYNNVLSSSDGLLLLGGSTVDDLCLCNTMIGGYTFLPVAALPVKSYILLTCYYLPLPHGTISWIIAVEAGWSIKDTRLTYQLFSYASGVVGSWGAVKHATECIYPGKWVVCHGTIYWFGNLEVGVHCEDKCAFNLDVRTGRIRMTKLPEQCQRQTNYSMLTLNMLATSRDGSPVCGQDAAVPPDSGVGAHRRRALDATVDDRHEGPVRALPELKVAWLSGHLLPKKQVRDRQCAWAGYAHGS
ncbi:hypothetical protein ACP70R_008124 [Stipagrostis hirtigluma subsp. patula]